MTASVSILCSPGFPHRSIIKEIKSLLPFVQRQREVLFFGAQNSETDTWVHFVGKNTLLQSMWRGAINPKERSKRLLTDVGRCEDIQQTWIILHFIEVTHLSEVSSETTTAFYHLEIWREEKGAREEELFFFFFFFYEKDAAYIQALRLSQELLKEDKTESWSLSNGMRKEQRTHRREEKGRRVGGWFKPAARLLGPLRKFWNYVKVICRSSWRPLDTTWGSRNRIWFQKLLSKMD